MARSCCGACPPSDDQGRVETPLEAGALDDGVGPPADQDRYLSQNPGAGSIC
jgi:hypothetical protein